MKRKRRFKGIKRLVLLLKVIKLLGKNQYSVMVFPGPRGALFTWWLSLL